MKTILFILVFFKCAVLTSAAQLATHTAVEEELMKKYLQSSRFKEFAQFNPNVKYFITTAYGNLEFGPKGIVTFIHETAHIYNNVKSTGIRNRRYYWYDSSLLLSVEFKEGFITSDSILNYLPSYVQKKALAQTYLACKNDCFSKSYGIYGLLEEFNAYSLEPSSLIEMYEFFDTCSYTNTPKFWEGYLKCKYDSWLNFYTFSIFFGTYLKYLEINQKGFYDQLINDSKFKSVFSKIFNKYNNDLYYLNCIDYQVQNKLKAVGYSKQYRYPFKEDLDTLKSICDNVNVQRYLSLIKTNQ